MKKILAIVVLLGLTACSGVRISQNDNPKKPLNVTASFYPLAYLAQRIGGDLVQVNQITPGGVEPHDYEPTPQDLIAIQNSKVFIINGYGIDAWADKIIDDLPGKGVLVVKATDKIENIIDSHVWLDPNYFKKEAEVVRDILIIADPANTAAYKLNTAGLTSDLTALDQEYRNGLAKCAIKEIITSHDAFNYLAKEYGFTSLAIAGLSPDEEPSPKHLAELAYLAKKNNIKYIFFETLLSPKLSNTIAKEIGAKSLALNPIEGLNSEETAKSEDYLVLMQQNLKNLRIAMLCK
ncbi:zinc ABC transporter substrate-binding protein [Candidatus Peregrinibacteria bacterium]|nr:zinc ABC transporter substrate-binding protein [Candidatus Peregrinibacteria bacterium]